MIFWLIISALVVIGFMAAGTLGAFAALLRRIVILLCLALLTGIVTGAYFGPPAGVIVAIMAFAVLVPGMLPRNKRRAVPKATVTAKRSMPTQPDTQEKRPGPSADPRFAAAWAALKGEADWAANRIAVAQEACDRYLARTTQSPGDELAAAMRRQIPAAIENELRTLSGLSASERRERLESLIDLLENYAAEAERLAGNLSETGPDHLHIQRAHLDNLRRRRRNLDG